MRVLLLASLGQLPRRLLWLYKFLYRPALDRLAGFISVKRENLTKHITLRIEGKNQFETPPPYILEEIWKFPPNFSNKSTPLCQHLTANVPHHYNIPDCPSECIWQDCEFCQLRQGLVGHLGPQYVHIRWTDRRGYEPWEWTPFQRLWASTILKHRSKTLLWSTILHLISREWVKWRDRAFGSEIIIIINHNDIIYSWSMIAIYVHTHGRLWSHISFLTSLFHKKMRNLLYIYNLQLHYPKKTKHMVKVDLPGQNPCWFLLTKVLVVKYTIICFLEYISLESKASIT